MEPQVALLTVRHNIEVAHRLFELPGKCENIHGHSMWVELSLYGGISGSGILETEFGTLEFGDVKAVFRRYLDQNYDHRLLLNQNDPWASYLQFVDENGDPKGFYGEDPTQKLPGLSVVPGDPTTEHLGLWMAEYFSNYFKTDTSVTVQETHVNAASVDWKYMGEPEEVGSGTPSE